MIKENEVLNNLKMDKVFNGFKKVFNLRNIGISKEDVIANDPNRIEYKYNSFYMDAANVLGVEFHNEYLKEWFYNTFNVMTSKVPDLNYSECSSKIESKYHIEYLFNAINIFKICKVNPVLNINKDYPISLHAEGLFTIVIAPRVGDN